MAQIFYDEPADTGAQALAACLNDHIRNKRSVLWLVSGGSNIAISKEISDALLPEAQEYLRSALVDERYGDPGHADSNHEKFLQSGFTLVSALPMSVLQYQKPIEAVAREYEVALANLWNQSDVIVAQLGIGADAHTLGILPHSGIVDSQKLVEHYVGHDYQRITMTLFGLEKVNTVFVFAYGADKQPALRALQHGDVPLDDAPCQILRKIPDVHLYNDQIRGEFL